MIEGDIDAESTEKGLLMNIALSSSILVARVRLQPDRHRVQKKRINSSLEHKWATATVGSQHLAHPASGRNNSFRHRRVAGLESQHLAHPASGRNSSPYFLQWDSEPQSHLPGTHMVNEAAQLAARKSKQRGHGRKRLKGVQNKCQDNRSRKTSNSPAAVSANGQWPTPSPAGGGFSEAGGG
ncbi:MAG TPA: hypothetical protein VMV78_00570 [Thiobacillus sp.]|nr:hypothetical protein [Thiobacillus sp.]